MWNIGSMASMDSSGAGSCRRVRTVSTISVKAAMEVKVALRQHDRLAAAGGAGSESQHQQTVRVDAVGSRSVGSKAV